MRILAIITALSLASHLYAQAQKDTPWTYNDFRWMQALWTGDEAEYIASEKQLTEVAKRVLLVNTTYDLLKKQAVSDPRNPVAQFRWAHFLLVTNTQKSIDYKARKTSFESELLEVWNLMRWSKTPPVRRHARIRFIVENSLSSRLDLVPIARRLYESDTKDQYIAYRYANLLAWVKSYESRKLAMSIAKDLLSKNETSSPYNSLVAKCFDYLWEYSKDVKDAKSAIHYYELSIKYATSEEWKDQARILIDSIKKNAKL